MKKKKIFLLFLVLGAGLIGLQSCEYNTPVGCDCVLYSSTLAEAIAVQNAVTKGEVRVYQSSYFDIRTIVSSVNKNFIAVENDSYVKQEDVLWAFGNEHRPTRKNESAKREDFIFETQKVSLMITPNFTGDVRLFFTRHISTNQKEINNVFIYGDSLSDELVKLGETSTTKPEDFMIFPYKQETFHNQFQFTKNLIQAAINVRDPRVLIIERTDENSSLKITSFDEGVKKVLNKSMPEKGYTYKWVFDSDKLKQFEENGLMKVNSE